MRHCLMAIVLLCTGFGATPSLAAVSFPHEIIDSAGPVIQYGISPDLNCSARYVGDTRGEFFGDTACATAIAAPEAVYAPSTIPAGPTLTSVSLPFAPISQVRSGTGSPGSPFVITTAVQAGDLRLTQTDSYAVGTSRLQTTMRVTNTSAQTVTFDVFRAGDCFARDSDFGFGQMGPQSAACVSAVEARTVRFVATPQAPAPQPQVKTFQGFYEDLWARIGSFAPGGARQDFDGSCRCAESIDNSAGLQWTLTLASGQEASIFSAIDFGPIATPGGFGAPIGTPPLGGKAYVALGDSYSSGTGAGEQGKAREYNYNYTAESNVPKTATTAENRCRRSTNAYPYVLLNRLYLAADHRLNLEADQPLDFRACTAAKIEHLRGANDEKHGYEPAQMSALGDDTQLVTLTIGGNDADFAGIVRTCVLPARFTPAANVGCNVSKESSTRAAFTAMAGYTGPKSLLLVYQEVMGRIRGDGTLAVLGYPDFTPFGGGCQTADRFSQAESEWLSNWIRTFNTMIEQRAAWAGAMFIDVDRLYQPLSGTNHRVCSSDEWVNGVRWVNGVPGVAAIESFHPNKLGQQANADAAYRRIFRGESNEALQTVGAGTFERTQQLPQPHGPSLSSVVVRKTTPASIPVDVVAGKTTVASLRYEGAAPILALTDATGAPVTIGAIDPKALVARATGATSARVGNTTVLELRQLPAGRYGLSVSLPADAPTDAGVLGIRFTTLTETNLEPVVALRATLRAGRVLRVSAPGSLDPEGGALTFRWTFGDRRIASGATTSHRYRKAGRYLATLTVSDPAGGMARRRVVVETRPQLIARVATRRQGKNKALVTFTCTRSAVEACQARLRVVIRSGGGRQAVRQLDVSAKPGRRATFILALPATKKTPFTGTVRLSGVASDEAVRVAGQRVTASMDSR